jgi:hypothetical protein
VILGKHDVKSRLIASAQPADEREFGLPVHMG